MTPFPFQRNLIDDNLRKTVALPASASTTVTTAAVDLGAANYRRPDSLEAFLEVPALSATILPDTRTATLTIEVSDAAGFGSGVTTIGTLVLTGAGGAGAAASQLRVALPPIPTGARYIRGKVAFGASTTDGSALSAEFGIVS